MFPGEYLTLSSVDWAYIQSHPATIINHWQMATSTIKRVPLETFFVYSYLSTVTSKATVITMLVRLYI